MKSGPSRNGNHDDIYSHARTRSLVSTSSKTRFDEIDEVPMRTSSLRNWSMTSASPTLSSTSSNPFASSQSRHTPNTSVDLSRALSSVFASSRSSLNSGLYQQSYCTAPETHMQSPAKPQTTGFNMDDYLSSDDDSFIEPRRSRGEGEKDLLFKDYGYGFEGAQLPGLEDSLAAPAPIVRKRSPRSSMSLPSGDLRLAYSSNPPTAGRPFTPDRYARSTTARRYIVDPSLGYHENSDRFYATDADDFLSRLLPTAPGQLQDRRPKTSSGAARRISALGSAYSHLGFSVGDEVIEEERLEKIDVATAVRMRKEAKAHNRAMAMVKRRNMNPVVAKGKGKGKEGLRVARDFDDEACHADVE